MKFQWTTGVNLFHTTVSFYTPENIRKPLVFGCFQGVQKETSGMKWVKELVFDNKNKRKTSIDIALTLLLSTLNKLQQDEQAYLLVTLNMFCLLKSSKNNTKKGPYSVVYIDQFQRLSTDQSVTVLSLLHLSTQPTFTFSKLAIETSEQSVKYVQSYQ